MSGERGQQPIVDHAHGEVCGFEALSRPFEENSAIAPEVRFRLACEQGRHIETDLLVLQDALTTVIRR
ncbi:EAL domain-containing protein [Alicyclobacillus curvatus]|nr:EAL domain-containing protein [Alicyclobacillus curvatus]